MDKFLQLKLKRGYIAALFEKEKLDEALAEYNNYKQKCAHLRFSKEAKEELKTINSMVVEKLDAIAKESFKKENYDIALKCYENIFSIEPKNTKNLSNYITALEKVKQLDLALNLSYKLIELEKNESNYKNIARILVANKKFIEGIEMYKKAFKSPDENTWSACDCNTLGCYYFDLYTQKEIRPEYIKKSYDLFKLAIKKHPDGKTYIKNMTSAANKAKDLRMEKTCWKKCIKYNYMNDNDWFTYSAFCMRNGDVEDWATYYEWRFKKPEFDYLKAFKKPYWSGEDISDKTLLVRCEQGFGDNFLMWGYMSRLTKIAKKVIYVAPDEVADLFSNNDLGVKVIAKKDLNLDKLHYDCFIPCMSIPFALKLNRRNISVGHGYLKVDNGLVEQFKEKYFNNDKFKIGFAYLGLVNKTRDIPFDKLLMLDKLKDVHFYCLSKGVPDEQLKKFKKNKVTNIVADCDTFLQTAAAIENCDLVVTSDNCILNLAAALGKRTIGVFSYHYEFRWYDLNDKDCGWFDCVKPFINNEYNDWKLTMERVVDEVNAIKNKVP